MAEREYIDSLLLRNIEKLLSVYISVTFLNITWFCDFFGSTDYILFWFIADTWECGHWDEHAPWLSRSIYFGTGLLLTRFNKFCFAESSVVIFIHWCWRIGWCHTCIRGYCPYKHYGAIAGFVRYREIVPKMMRFWDICILIPIHSWLFERWDFCSGQRSLSKILCSYLWQIRLMVSTVDRGLVLFRSANSYKDHMRTELRGETGCKVSRKINWWPLLSKWCG